MDKTALELLARCIPNVSDIRRYAYEVDGRFYLSDSKSCLASRINHPCPDGCNNEILRIETNNPVTVVSFDEWLKDHPNSTCDYLVFDSDEKKQQFAFCELTCSVERYVEPSENRVGKRAKAYSQMMATWQLIAESENPSFKADIMRYMKKIGLFGWRDRESRGETGPMRSLRGFTRTPSSRARVIRFSDYAFGENFEFIQVKYPHVFIWNAPYP